MYVLGGAKHIHSITRQASIYNLKSDRLQYCIQVLAEANSITVRSQMVEAGLSSDAFAEANLDRVL